MPNKRIARIIITAPHSLCRDKQNRDCDRRAHEMALAIHEKLSGKYSTSLHLSNLYRCDIDGNRKLSRGTKWRRNITQDIEESIAKYGKESVLLLDVHSLTGYMPEFTVNDIIPVIAVVSWDARVTILQQRLAMAIGKPVWGFWATRRADIITEANNAGIMSILIEHNEKYTQLTKQDVMRELDVIDEFVNEVHEVQPVGDLHIKQPGGDEFVLCPGTQPLPIQWLPWILIIIVCVVFGIIFGIHNFGKTTPIGDTIK